MARKVRDGEMSTRESHGKAPRTEGVDGLSLAVLCCANA